MYVLQVVRYDLRRLRWRRCFRRARRDSNVLPPASSESSALAAASESSASAAASESACATGSRSPDEAPCPSRPGEHC